MAWEHASGPQQEVAPGDPIVFRNPAGTIIREGIAISVSNGQVTDDQVEVTNVVVSQYATVPTPAALHSIDERLLKMEATLKVAGLLK